MIQNIFVGVMCVIVAAVAVWGWWLENGSEKKDTEDGKKERDVPERESDPVGQEGKSAGNTQKSPKEKK